MEKGKLALSLLFAAVIVSGCADNGGGKVSGEAISVTGPTVQPSEIREGSSVQVSMSAQNTGNIPGKVLVGDNGTRILTNYCSDFFSIPREGFSSYSSRNADTAETYTLRPDETIQLNWQLDQDGGNVPINGYNCPTKFQLPFNYSVDAYQQLQITQRDTEAGVGLSSKTSQGPLSIAIQTIGSSSQTGAPVFLEDDNPEVLIQVFNERPEQSALRGLIKIKDIEIGSSGVELGEGCKDIEETIRINQNQESEIIRCDINGMELDGVPSKRAEITASANYTYVKSLGSRNIQVKYSGN